MNSAKASTFLWFAIWSGFCVACIYFCQPLLHLFGQEFQVSDEKVSLVATATQIGYGVGIFLLLPLGDFFERRRLVLIKLVVLAIASLACAMAPSLGSLIAGSFILGLFATTAQDFIPVAADLAPENRRGQYIGFVMTGLMLGILLSRTVSGIVASHFGWRTVFEMGAGLILFCFLTCLRFFPALPTSEKSSLLSIYSSMWALLRKHSELRVAVFRHGLMGMAFSGFWTCLSFFLSAPPYSWDSSRIGLMGLAGAAGAVSTSVGGRFADRRGPLSMIRIGLALCLISFVAMGIFSESLGVLIVGVVLFDLGIQSSLISHQSIIYGLDPKARARINGIFVSSLFVFFSLGSYFSALVWTQFGWKGLMSACTVATVIALLMTLRSPSRSPQL